jgi:hypothetical protein
MLILRSSELLARVDPLHGGEILDLIDLETGRQLLGRLPFGTTDRGSGPLDEVEWIEGWRGGWQTCIPNPGNRCEVDGASYGFHGSASHEPWEVLSANDGQLTMRWNGHGLEVTRTLQIDRQRLIIDMAIASRASAAVPYAMLEHVSLGLEVLDPVLELELPPARTIEVSDQDGPVRAPLDAPRWPLARLLDGSIERVDRLELRAAPRNCFLSVQDLPEGRAIARGRRAGLELTWDAVALPHAWIWYELRASEGPFRGLAEIVAIEPSSLGHSLGLSRALREGQANVLEPGAASTYRITARTLSAVERDGGS